MNCPNCGGLINLNEKHCEYCNTTFTDKELGIETGEVKTAVKEEASKKKLTYTEQKQLELQEEKSKRKTSPDPEYSRDIATGAAVMGVFGLFAGVRRFFRELKRTVCFILLIALEAGFGYIMISGVASDLLETELQNFILQNAIVLLNALLAGIICRIGRIRVGTALVAIINLLAVVWVFIYPLIATNFAGVTPQNVAILAVVEMAILALSVLFAHLIYRR